MAVYTDATGRNMKVSKLLDLEYGQPMNDFDRSRFEVGKIVYHMLEKDINNKNKTEEEYAIDFNTLMLQLGRIGMSYDKGNVLYEQAVKGGYSKSFHDWLEALRGYGHQISDPDNFEHILELEQKVNTKNESELFEENHKAAKGEITLSEIKLNAGKFLLGLTVCVAGYQLWRKLTR